MSALRALGARSVPVVSRGTDYVFAQVIGDVIKFLDLPEDGGPQLTPQALAERALLVLDTGARLVRQMPDGELENELPNRPRSWRVLMHHIFQIGNAYLESQASGKPMQYEDMVAPPPDEMRNSAHIAAFGDEVRTQFSAWWETAKASDFSLSTEVYFGATSRHEFLERTVWHSAQHVRQLASLLERTNIVPDRPLELSDLEGLPLTEKVWD